MLAFCDEAPADADAVRITFNGTSQELPVKDRVYLTVWWSVPCPGLHDYPRAVAFRIDGRWTEYVDPMVEFLERARTDGD